MDIFNPALFKPTSGGVDLVFRAYRPGLGADYSATVHVPNTGWTQIRNGWRYTSNQGSVRSMRIRNVAATPTQPANVVIDLS